MQEKLIGLGAKIMEKYWKATGVALRMYVQAGVKVTRPDFSVVRVSLLGLDEAKADNLYNYLKKSKCESARIHARTSEIKGRQRRAAHGPGSQAKKYVNVAGGTGADPELRGLCADLKAKGYYATVTEGPLMRATTGGKQQKTTLMPLAVSSAFAPTKDILEKAHVKANADPLDPDPDLDLPPDKAPSWSTHSIRRAADTVARRDREVTETSEAEIDIYFGWHEKILLKDMQVHYSSMSLREKMRQSRITGRM